MSESGERVRAFFALVPDENAAAFLKGRCSDLRQALPEAALVRWVRPEKLHLTLRFLGEVKCDGLDELVNESRETLDGLKAFFIRIGGPMLFPNPRRPFVIAAAIEDHEKLKQLADTLERIAIRCGLGADRFELRPHITLGRVKRGARLRRLPESSGESAGWIANEVVLMRSELTECGPVYSPIHRFSLERM